MMTEFSDLVRQTRIKKYKTARDFYRDKSLSCTYAYYSKVENGTVPEMAIAMEIISKLELNSRKALFAWTRDHMPTTETKSYFSEVDDQPLSSEQTSSSRSLVVNRMQAKLLEGDPLYWELLVFINACYGQPAHKAKELSKQFGLKVPHIEKYLKTLFEYGLLERTKENAYFAKEWTFIPYEDEFKPLRNLNFKRAFDQFLRSDPSSQFRTTITCPLLPRHQKIIESKVLALSNFIVDLSESDTTEEANPYTIGIFSSPRRFGHE